MASGSTATIAPTTPTKRPIKLKKDPATEKPQTCKQKHKKNQHICAAVSKTAGGDLRVQVDAPVQDQRHETESLSMC